MQIIEQFIKGKRPDQTKCEDGYIVTDNFVAVIDGVTSKGKQLWSGKTSGRYAMEIVKDIIPTLSPDITKEEMFRLFDTALKTAYETDVLTDECSEYLRCCVLIYSKFYNKIWMVGDCQFYINDNLITDGKLVDDLLSNVRALVIESAIADGFDEKDLAQNDVGRKAILDIMKAQFNFENNANSRFGYGVLNGHGIDNRFIKEFDVPQGATLVFASDGYPTLCKTLADSEKALENVLQNDPECYKIYRATKGIAKGNCSFDDRTYIKFIV